MKQGQAWPCASAKRCNPAHLGNGSERSVQAAGRQALDVALVRVVGVAWKEVQCGWAIATQQSSAGRDQQKEGCGWA